jgi:hypothetical protein
MRTPPMPVASVTLLITLPILPLPAAYATGGGTFTLFRAALAISTPTSAVLGSTSPGGTISAHMGTVTVDDTRPLLANWTATASATNFTTGGGTSPETITKGNLSYWSGPVTASVGIGTRIPGQLTALNAVSLATTITAFSLQALVLGTSTSWNPTIVVSVPSSAVTGTYTGTITHSVA